MTLAYDLVRTGVLTVIAIIIHRMGVELFSPDGVLYDVATDGTGNVNGPANAQLWFEIIAIWAPLAVMGFAVVYTVVRIYKRQVQTAAARAPR